MAANCWLKVTKNTFLSIEINISFRSTQLCRSFKLISIFCECNAYRNTKDTVQRRRWECISLFSRCDFSSPSIVLKRSLWTGKGVTQIKLLNFDLYVLFIFETDRIDCTQCIRIDIVFVGEYMYYISGIIVIHRPWDHQIVTTFKW